MWWCRFDLDTYVVLLTELLAQGSAHDVAADARRRTEVCLARLAPRGVEGFKEERIVSKNRSLKKVEQNLLLLVTLTIVTAVAVWLRGVRIWLGGWRRKE